MATIRLGAGVRALRAQIDKIEYHNFFKKLVDENEFIDLILGEAEDFLAQNNQAVRFKINGKVAISFCVPRSCCLDLSS